MRRLVAFAVALVATLAPVALPASTGASVACAATTPHAGLVIDTGTRTLELCVELDAARVSGLHLVELAGAQYGLQYGFGLGGQGMCRLDGTGPTGDDCFADYPDFWGYWKGDGSGAWAWASMGAASSTVGDGELDGWVWGTGDTGNTHAKPPGVSIDDVCPPAASPTPKPEPSPSPAPSRSPSASPSSRPEASAGQRSPAAAGSSPAPVASAPAPTSSSRSASPERSTRSASPSRRPEATMASNEIPSRSVAALASATNEPGGSGLGLAAALTLAAILGLGGWLRVRAGRRGPTG